ncbi:MAG: hypothetical protein IKW90_01660 [Lachnospiraceae bacterium]|nr:hypothetical protein [Lachnospiraceae bacterium]
MAVPITTWVNDSAPALSAENLNQISQSINLPIVLDRISQYGIKPFNGGLNTINQSTAVDTRYVYYNSNSGASSYKLVMWHNGTSWVNIGGGIKTDDISEYLTYPIIADFDLKSIIISRIILYGADSFTGNLTKLNSSTTIDKKKIFYHATSNKIAWYDGANWVYFGDYTITDFNNVIRDTRYSEIAEIIKRFLKNGATPYNGGLDTLNSDVSADTGKIYYNKNTGASSYGKIMFYNGTAFEYSTMFASYTELENGIVGIAKNIYDTEFEITVGTCNCGGFEYGDGETSESEYLANWHSMFNKMAFNVFVTQEWASDLIYSESDWLGDTITGSFPPNNVYTVRLFAKGSYEKDHRIDYSEGAGLGYSILKTIGNKNIAIYGVYCQYGDTEEQAEIRQIQYQNIISDITSNGYTQVIILGDFNAHAIDEYDIFKENGFSICNGGYTGEVNTLRDLPADNIVFKGLKLKNFETITDFNLNTDHTPIKAVLIG